MALGSIVKAVSSVAKAASAAKKATSSSLSKSSGSSSSSGSRSSGGSYTKPIVNNPSPSKPPTNQPTYGLFDDLFSSFKNVIGGGNKSSNSSSGNSQSNIPYMEGLTDYQLSEIKRKAESGESLLKPTMQKNDLYDYYRNIYLQNQEANKPAPTMSQQMLPEWMNQQQQIYNPQSDMYDMYRQMAEQQSQQWYQEQRNALDSLVSQLQNQQKSQLMGITNGVQDAEASLEDSSFQDYLAARQAMADRGLAGSGLASDQDTRLLLSKQRNLAGIYRDAEQQQFDVNSQIGNSLQEVYNRISGLSAEGKEQELFQGMFSEAQKNMVEQSKTYADMLKEIMGYDTISATDQAKMNLEQWQTQQGNLLEKYKSDQKFQTDMIGLGLKEREIGIAQLRADRDYSVEMSKQMGYLVGMDGKPITDSQGQMIPTVDKQRLDETVRNNMANNELDWGNLQEKIRHNMHGEQFDYDKLSAQVTQWAETNKLESRNLNIRENDLARLIEKDAAVITEMSQNATTAQQKIQIDALGKSLTSLNKQIESIQKSGKEYDKMNDDEKKAFDKLVNDRNDILDQLQRVANSNINFQIPMEGGR